MHIPKQFTYKCWGFKLSMNRLLSVVDDTFFIAYYLQYLWLISELVFHVKSELPDIILVFSTA